MKHFKNKIPLVAIETGGTFAGIPYPEDGNMIEIEEKKSGIEYCSKMHHCYVVR